MASSNRQTPPPSPPPAPMTSQENHQAPGHAAAMEGGAGGKGKSSKREKKEEIVADEVERFDSYYGKKGNVYVFPDVLEPRVKAYQKQKKSNPPPGGNLGTGRGTKTQHKGTKATPSQGQSDTKSRGKRTADTSRPQTSSSEQKTGDANKKRQKIKEPDSFVLDKKKLEESKKSGQIQGEEGELVVIERTKAALEEITGSDDIPVFLLHNHQLGEERNVEIDILVLHPSLGVLVLEVKATANTTNYSDFNKATTQLLKAQELIQEEMGDLLEQNSFYLTIALPNLKQGDDVIIRKEVEERKARRQRCDVTEQAASSDGEPAVKTASGTTEQATIPSTASDAIPSTATDAIPSTATDAIPSTATDAIPSTATDAIPSTATDARPDRKASSASSTAPQAAMPASDVTASTSRQSGKQGGAGNKCGKGDGHKKIELLENHPGILLVCGSTPEVFTELIGRLKRLRATASHAFRGSTMEERVESFKKACIRRCSVAGLSPGLSVRDSAAVHRRFLLTEEQLCVRDSQAQLLHISGPPGSGKTLLLAERARRWLREGRRLTLMVGNPFSYDVLLRHLTDSVCGEKTDVARVSTHIDYTHLLEWLPTVSTEDPVSVIVDEARFPSLSSFYSELLHHVTAGRVCGLWTAYTSPLSDEDKTELQSLGVSTVQLSVCLRCPPHVMALTNSVRGKHDLPLLPPPVPVTRELGVEVKVISHPHHRPSQPWDICPTCKEEGTAIFSSLGLLGQHATSALSLSDVIVITTEIGCDRKSVAAWLRGLGLHAVVETETLRYYDTPVLPPGVAPSPGVEAKAEAVRQRILKGKDVRDRPAVHVVWCEDFQGLERPVVLLWHQDRQDEHRDWQTQRGREYRMSRHRDLWFRAASRCQGRLVVMATTPSPLLSLLPATSLPKSSTSTASSNSGLKSASPARQPPTTPQSPADNRSLIFPDILGIIMSMTRIWNEVGQPCTPSSHHSPVSSSSLGGESNPRPSSPPEWEINYQRCQTGPDMELGLSSLSVTSRTGAAPQMSSGGEESASERPTSPP